MKKMILRGAACALALAITLSFAACGTAAPAESSPSSAASSEAVSSEVVSSEPVSSTPSSEEETSSAPGITTLGKFASVSDFVNSEIMQSQIESITQSAEASGMSITITADGDKLVYTYTYPALDGIEGLAEQLDSALESQASTFENIATSLRSAVEVENPIVVVTYVDSEGTVIVSKEFQAQ